MADSRANQQGEGIVTRTLLVGIDGTESSRAALRWATKRAAATGAEVNLTHVINDDWATIGARMLEELEEDARLLLGKEVAYAHTLAAQVSIHTQVLHGDVMQELIAASKQAEMVVVGTHKTGFISGKVFGSRSLRLAASAYVPVAVIPQGSPRDGRGIVVGVDDSAAGRLAIRFAAREAERTGEALTLLRAFTVLELSTANNDVQHELAKHSESRASIALSEAAALASLAAPNLDVKVRSVQRSTAQALVDAAATAALLVIGDSSREGTENALVGSVSHDVLINLTGPAIIVHAGDPR
jgi:nucleotide-binding universal stress UspA family protein